MPTLRISQRQRSWRSSCPHFRFAFSFMLCTDTIEVCILTRTSNAAQVLLLVSK